MMKTLKKETVKKAFEWAKQNVNGLKESLEIEIDGQKFELFPEPEGTDLSAVWEEDEYSAIGTVIATFQKGIEINPEFEEVLAV